MQNDLKYEGYFYLPGNENNEVYGTILYSQRNGILLELAGSLHDVMNQEIFKPDIILGNSLNGKKITLHKCFESNKHISSPGYISTIFSAIHLFIGAHFQDVNNINFSEVYLQFNNLDEWLDISGLNIDDSKYQSDKELIINFKLPGKINYKLNEDIDFGFSFSHSSFQINANQKEINLEQYSNLFFLFNSKDADLNTILDLIIGFQTFLSLATFAVTYPCSIILINRDSYNEQDNMKYPEEIYLYFERSKMVDESHDQNKFQMLFSYEKVRIEFQQIFQKWLSIRKDLRPTINLLFDYFYKSKTITTNNFLNIIHAIETYHRQRFNNYLISPEKHKERLDKIYNSVSKEYLSWLKEKLTFSHEPSLKERLEEIMETVKSEVLLEVLGNKNEIISDAKNTRNYYIHFSSNLKMKSLKVKELYHLTEKLMFLLIYCLLKDIGINENDIDELFSKNRYFLFSHLNY